MTSDDQSTICSPRRSGGALPSPGPENSLDLARRFHDESACVAAIIRWRWPEGWRCAVCGHDAYWWSARRRVLHCASCRRQRSITSGTLFEGTHAPLRKWFFAIWLCLSSKRGVSAMELGRQVGISTSTAWRWLHKLRAMLDGRKREKLRGLVEIDETYLGGLDQGRPGRSLGRKNPVVAAIEQKVPPPGFGRLRMASLPNAKASTLEDFARRHVKKEAIVLSDAHSGYRRLEALGYSHVAVNVKATGRPAHEPLPGTHRVFSLIRRMLLGTFQAAARKQHRGAYAAEYEFRFNRRHAASRGDLWAEAMRMALDHVPLKCRRMSGGWCEVRGGSWKA